MTGSITWSNSIFLPMTSVKAVTGRVSSTRFNMVNSIASAATGGGGGKARPHPPVKSKRGCVPVVATRSLATVANTNSNTNEISDYYRTASRLRSDFYRTVSGETGAVSDELVSATEVSGGGVSGRSTSRRLPR